MLNMDINEKRCPDPMEKSESTYNLHSSESTPSIPALRTSHQVPDNVKYNIKHTVDFVRNLKLEAFLLLYVMSFSMRLIITQDLLLTKACIYHFNLTEEICDHPDEALKSSTEKLANTINLLTILVQLLPSAVLSIFVGTWSDKYGNKIPIMVAILGGVINDIGNIFTALSIRSSLYWSVLAAVPNGLSGGLVCVWAAVYSHATISTSPELRTLKFLMISLALQLGFPFGQFISGQVFNSWGYIPVYASSLVLLLGCFLWMVFIVGGQKNQTVSKATMAKDFFKLDNFSEGVRTTMRERPNSGRKQILLMLLTMCIIVLNAETTRSVTYFFVKKRFDWSVTKYSDVTSMFALTNLISIGPIVLILTKVLKVRDVTLSIIGVVSMFFQNLSRGFATKEWMYYASGVLGTAGGVSTIGITSHVSRLVSQKEIARMFSFWAACEAMVPVLGDILSSQIFNATIDAFPGSPFVVSSLLLILPLISLTYCYRKTTEGFLPFEDDMASDSPTCGSELATSPSIEA